MSLLSFVGVCIQGEKSSFTFCLTFAFSSIAANAFRRVHVSVGDTQKGLVVFHVNYYMTINFNDSKKSINEIQFHVYLVAGIFFTYIF